MDIIPRMNHKILAGQFELLDGTDHSKTHVSKSLVDTLHVLQVFDIGFWQQSPRRLGRVTAGLFVYSTALVDQDSTKLRARLGFRRTLILRNSKA